MLRLLAAAVVAVRGPKPTGELNARQVRIDVRAASPFTTDDVVTLARAIADGADVAFGNRFVAGSTSPRCGGCSSARRGGSSRSSPALACGTGTRLGSSAVNGLLKTIASIMDGICASGITSET